ncbi:MAG: hypothetical protein IIV91_00220 [Alistipes sp.]|jgi:hypothetical protein|nr:hypothetical protein [Alistipes sp.]
MKQFNAAHLEIKRRFSESFETHPYECGWADEAIFYILVLGIEGKEAQLRARVQISLDGVHWTDEGTKFEPIGQPGLYFVKVSHFGNYLRLATEIEGGEFDMQVQIACKG